MSKKFSALFACGFLFLFSACGSDLANSDNTTNSGEKNDYPEGWISTQDPVSLKEYRCYLRNDGVWCDPAVSGLGG